MKRQTLFVAIFVLSLVACGGDGTAQDRPVEVGAEVPPTNTPSTHTVEETLIYYISERELDVYAPSEPGSWPVVVALHGWPARKESLKALSRAIAAQGTVVFTPNWRGGPPAANAITAGWEDAACAVRFARAMAPDYGGDPSRLVLVGHSAGGAAGATMALAGDDFEGDCVVTEGSALPDAFVGLDGAYNILEHVPVENLQQASTEEWAVISPFAYVDRRPIRPDLELHLIVGREEPLIGYAEEFQVALEAAGYSTTLTLLPGVGHMEIVDPRVEGVLQTIMEAARR